MKITVILDANVMVSALFGGTPRDAVRRALEEDLCISPEIEAEWTVLKKKLQGKVSFRVLRYWAQTFLPSLLKRMRRVDVPRRLTVCRDPKDDAYLSLAKAVDAAYLVTGDDDLLSLSRADLEKVGLARLCIVTPRGFCERVRK